MHPFILDRPRDLSAALALLLLMVLASMPSASKLGGTTPLFSAFWMGLIRCDCPGGVVFSKTLVFVIEQGSTC